MPGTPRIAAADEMFTIAAPSASARCGHRVARAPHELLQRDRHDRVPRVVGDLAERAVAAARTDEIGRRGVVHERREPAVACWTVAATACSMSASPAEVGAHVGRITAGGADLLLHRVAAGLGAAGDHDGGALGREPRRDRPADAAGRTRDKRDLSRPSRRPMTRCCHRYAGSSRDFPSGRSRLDRLVKTRMTLRDRDRLGARARRVGATAHALARRMGGDEKVAKHHAQGKLTVRERIDALLDPESFHEIGALTGRATYDDDGHVVDVTPANFVMGRGRIDGRDRRRRRRRLHRARRRRRRVDLPEAGACRAHGARAALADRAPRRRLGRRRLGEVARDRAAFVRAVQSRLGARGGRTSPRCPSSRCASAPSPDSARRVSSRATTA